jgi:hypothetical protein
MTFVEAIESLDEPMEFQRDESLVELLAPAEPFSVIPS